MRVICDCPAGSASVFLFDGLRKLGIKPEIINQMVRVDYEGDDYKRGEAIAYLFQKERTHSTEIRYDKNGKTAEERQAARVADQENLKSKYHGC